MAANEAEGEKVVLVASKRSGENDEAKAFVPEDDGAIMVASDIDVISGRGAAVNLNPGNRRFRDLCFKRKPEFDAASHAAKRRIAGEIVAATKATNGRFLKRKVDKGPWYEMTDEQALLKASQVMRDYQRPDRLASRPSSGNGRKTRRIGDSEEVAPPLPAEPLAPIIENPYGVHDHDVLSGRGAFVNGHVGNEAFRKLCIERKAQFDSGNYTEKRALASEVVNIIHSKDPPGRFLKRAAKDADGTVAEETVDGEWVELTDEKAVHKACQVMRDIARPDRQGDRRRRKRAKKEGYEDGTCIEVSMEGAKDSMTILAETTAEASAVEEAVAATEEALDNALDTVPKKKEVGESAVV
jgi:hypothetical protein